ncbi:MAG: branched-chain amino acid aminotransferase [Clostridiales bacterium]|jgi:branched-chain amino acid aminotransferase|nr:branched-chain amino acid aminotransferase [Clostridiales bacterium]
MNGIQFIRTKAPKQKPDKGSLQFGNIFSDHMFVMDYSMDKGWHDPRIIPYGPFEAEPSMMVFHYGQAIFEGLKAYRNMQGEIVTFRPMDNIVRLNRSAERLCIPKLDEEFVWEALKMLLEIEKDWVPDGEGTSLYIRPFIIATDPYLGVRPSHTYKFFIILSPVGAYYAEGFEPVKIYVTDKYVRAARGGLGYTKAAANYAASLYAAEEAKKKGYTQVLWLDACHHSYVEEVGTMNIFFKIGEVLVTPSLEGGSILGGITRDSVITLASSMGYKVEERLISIQEVFEAHEQGRLEDVFGTGTAAVISPVGELNWNDRIIKINGGKTGNFSKMMYEKLTGIQYGKEEDTFGWVKKIC